MLMLEHGIGNQIGSKFWRGMAAATFAGLLLTGCGDSGAERQKEASEIAKSIEDYLALIETPSQPVRIRHDKVTVTPAEDGKSFLVAITGMRYGTDTKAQATFGEIDYRMTPDGAPGSPPSSWMSPATSVMVSGRGPPAQPPRPTPGQDAASSTRSWSSRSRWSTP